MYCTWNCDVYKWRETNYIVIIVLVILHLFIWYFMYVLLSFNWEIKFTFYKELAMVCCCYRGYCRTLTLCLSIRNVHTAHGTQPTAYTRIWINIYISSDILLSKSENAHLWHTHTMWALGCCVPYDWQWLAAIRCATVEHKNSNIMIQFMRRKFIHSFDKLLFGLGFLVGCAQQECNQSK